MPTPTATERLAHFIHDIDPAQFPAAVREQATLCVLDALGIALAGMSEPSARAARAVARNAGGREESRVLDASPSSEIGSPRGIRSLRAPTADSPGRHALF
jgi:2-methylcitrate dehydratase PrpD